MLFGIPLFSYILFVSAAITLAIGIYALARADSEIRVIFFMLMIAITAWSFFQGLEMASASMHDKILWAQAEYLGISTTPLLWFLLSINYGSRLSPRMRRVFYLLFVVPIITIVMAFTNSEHHLLWKDFAFAREVIPTVSAGPLILRSFCSSIRSLVTALMPARLNPHTALMTLNTRIILTYSLMREAPLLSRSRARLV